MRAKRCEARAEACPCGLFPRTTSDAFKAIVLHLFVRDLREMPRPKRFLTSRAPAASLVCVTALIPHAHAREQQSASVGEVELEPLSIGGTDDDKNDTAGADDKEKKPEDKPKRRPPRASKTGRFSRGHGHAKASIYFPERSGQYLEGTFDDEAHMCFGRNMEWAIIAPDSKWKNKWDYLIIIFVLYNSLFIPFR